MKVVCIRENKYKSLTLHKIYQGTKFFDKHYYVIDDSGLETLYDKFYFSTLEEFREKQLNQILG